MATGTEKRLHISVMAVFRSKLIGNTMKKMENTYTIIKMETLTDMQIWSAMYLMVVIHHIMKMEIYLNKVLS